MTFPFEGFGWTRQCRLPGHPFSLPIRLSRWLLSPRLDKGNLFRGVNPF